jgi:hypothetical protein
LYCNINEEQKHAEGDEESNTEVATYDIEEEESEDEIENDGFVVEEEDDFDVPELTSRIRSLLLKDLKIVRYF